MSNDLLAVGIRSPFNYIHSHLKKTHFDKKKKKKKKKKHDTLITPVCKQGWTAEFLENIGTTFFSNSASKSLTQSNTHVVFYSNVIYLASGMMD